jgi:hypothetical protein
MGGFSRLIKFAGDKLNIKSLFTFIDLRYGSGNYLEGLGFKHINTSVSFKWASHKKTYHRMNFSGNTGYNKGYYKIWDCGQSKYVLRA